MAVRTSDGTLLTLDALINNTEPKCPYGGQMLGSVALPLAAGAMGEETRNIARTNKSVGLLTFPLPVKVQSMQLVCKDLILSVGGTVLITR